MPFQRFLLLATPLIFAVIWSTGWIAAKYAAPHADPLWYLTIRFSCAAAVITIFAAAVGAPWPKGTRNWLHALISGVLLHGIYLGGVWWAVKHGLSAGLSGLLAALQPLITAWLGPYLLSEDVSRRQWAGVAFGLLGVVLVLSPKLGFAGGLASETAWVPLAINVLGVVSLTAGSFYQKRFVSTGDLRTVTSVQYLGALLVVLPLALLTEDLFFDHSFEVYAVLVWSVLVLSVFRHRPHALDDQSRRGHAGFRPWLSRAVHRRHPGLADVRRASQHRAGRRHGADGHRRASRDPQRLIGTVSTHQPLLSGSGSQICVTPPNHLDCQHDPVSRPFFALLAPFLLALVLIHGAAFAQDTPKAQLDGFRNTITSLERELQGNLTNDKGLLETKGKLDPLLDQLRGFVGEQIPQLEGIKARLEQLGPKADTTKGQVDNPEVAKEREGQEKAQREVEALLALARNHIVAVEQLGSKISDQRRTLLTKALMERTSSVFSPVLWLDVAKALPGEFRSAQVVLSQWVEHIVARLDVWRLAVLAAAVIILGIVAVPGNRFVRRFEGRPDLPAPADYSGKKGDLRPTRLKRALAALRVTIIWAVVPIIVCAGIYNLLDSLDLITDRVENTVRTLLFGVAFVAFAHGLADGILGPDDPQWRLLDVEDRVATRITRLASVFTGIIVAGKTLEALNQAIYAVLPVTVATKAAFALLGGLAIVLTLRGLRQIAEEEGAGGSGEAPQIAAAGMSGAVRLVGWTAAAAILLAVTMGYVALSTFLADQIIWIVMVGALLLIVTTLVDEYVGHGISPDGAIGKQIISQVGLSKSSLKQISILSNGFFRVVLFIAAAMFVLAPWGLDGGDTVGTLRAALFGFSVGGVTISISTIILAIAFFAIGFAITKGIKRWLEKSYLPHTKLDVGLRNSIATSVGYIGIIMTAMLAASTLGLSLDKFTIIAGALSVGIGFGLQSIINNFVSGLILLWERPIRVGDWIVVGEEQGIVKRINVRSTQIETFDRASLIVPNSEFISGRVKNWMHNDRTARIVIPIGVGYGSDPEKVKGTADGCCAFEQGGAQGSGSPRLLHAPR